MTRSFLRAGALGAALTSGAACHLLLDGQDLGGSGAGSQGGAGGQTQTVTGSTTTDGSGGQTGTTDQVSSTNTGPSTATGNTCVDNLGFGDGMHAEDHCDSTPETGSECSSPACEPLGDGFYVHNFNMECAHEDWCAHLPSGSGGMITREQDGTLMLQSGQLTGWWSQGTPEIEFPTYLYRVIPSGKDFVFATRISYVAPDDGHYNVAGIVVRDPDDPWDVGGSEHWVKLEYGRRGSNPEPYQDFGVLLGEGVGDVANQEGGEPGNGSPGAMTQQDGVGLAVCRIGSDLNYFYDLGAGWTILNVDGQIQPFPPDDLQVGLTAGALHEEEAMVAAFDWATFIVEDSLGGCDCLGYLQGMAPCENKAE